MHALGKRFFSLFVSLTEVYFFFLVHQNEIVSLILLVE